jgi:ribosomal-protein-alanine N-acetyltransferase
VVRYLQWSAHTSIDETRQFIGECLMVHPDQRDFYWLVFTRETGELAGMIFSGILNRDASIGYLLRRQCWGRGYATEAARAVCDWIETQDGVDRLLACTDSQNFASRHVLEKLDFTFAQFVERSIVCPNIGPEPRDLCWYVREPRR